MILHKIEGWYLDKEYGNNVLAFFALLLAWLGNAAMYVAWAVGWVAATQLSTKGTTDASNPNALIVFACILSVVLIVLSISWLYMLEEKRLKKAKALKKAEEWAERERVLRVQQQEIELGLREPPGPGFVPAQDLAVWQVVNSEIPRYRR